MDFDFEIGFKVLLGLVLLAGLAGAFAFFALEDERQAWRTYSAIHSSNHNHLTELFECAAATSMANVYAELLALDHKALSLDGVRPAFDYNISPSARLQHLSNAQSSALELRSNLVFLVWLETQSARGRTPFPWSPAPKLSAEDVNRLVLQGMDAGTAEKLTPDQLEKIGPLLEGVIFSARSAALLNQQLNEENPDVYSALVQSWQLDLKDDPFHECGSFIRKIDFANRTKTIDPFLKKTH